MATPLSSEKFLANSKMDQNNALCSLCKKLLTMLGKSKLSLNAQHALNHLKTFWSISKHFVLNTTL